LLFERIDAVVVERECR